ncbi:MAG: hypothetical protein WC222_07705 [Parachlamydiales bacterium]|jgi:hypothetical protein
MTINKISSQRQSSSSQTPEEANYHCFPQAIVNVFSFMTTCKSKVTSVIYCPSAVCSFFAMLSAKFQGMKQFAIDSYYGNSSNSTSPTSPPPSSGTMGTVKGYFHQESIVPTQEPRKIRTATSVYGMPKIDEDKITKCYESLDKHLEILRIPRNSDTDYVTSVKQVAQAIVHLTIEFKVTSMWDMNLQTALDTLENPMPIDKLKDIRNTVNAMKNNLPRLSEENYPLILTHLIIIYTLGKLENEAILKAEENIGKPDSVEAQKAKDHLKGYSDALIKLQQDTSITYKHIKEKIDVGSLDILLYLDVSLAKKVYVDPYKDKVDEEFGTTKLV